MTTADMLAAVRARIGEPAESTRRDTELIAYMNEAQMHIVAGEAPDASLVPLTEIYVGVWVSGTYDYALPADFLHERYVEVNGYVAIRIPLLELDALRSNNLHIPSKTRPRYAIADGLLRFYTGSTDPDTLAFKVYYVRRPMYVRAASTASRTSNVVTLTTAAHGLTADNIGETIVVEGVVPTGATTFNGSFEIASVPSTTTLTYAHTATNDTGTGGRLIHNSLGQIAAGGSPIVPGIYHGAIMDWAVSRAREQTREFEEAARQATHVKQVLEAIKSRYGGGRPWDNIAGDPGRRQAQR